ncbi:hypothetical protein [Funiculus sociatus]|nr:hypothetical protein [Trichocoleus sp. FACHB-69]
MSVEVIPFGIACQPRFDLALGLNRAGHFHAIAHLDGTNYMQNRKPY